MLYLPQEILIDCVHDKRIPELAEIDILFLYYRRDDRVSTKRHLKSVVELFPVFTFTVMIPT